MQERIVDIKTISGLHEMYACEKPKHPLVTVIRYSEVTRDHFDGELFYCTPFYAIGCKRFKGSMKYGKSWYDFDEGTLMFTAPGQVISSSPDLEIEDGWGLFFHPDLINHTELGKKILNYSFFHYSANEALHISEDESQLLKDCIKKIEREYTQNIDKHTSNVIVSNIDLLLNYCDRFYDRQFITRAKVNLDIIQQFESLLLGYFAQETLIETGLPNVKYFANRLHLSPNYLSDLLNKHTGKSTLEFIHLQLVEKAKMLLLGTNKHIAEIAYELGFEHPSHFTKIFKAKTGKSPKEFRTLN